MGETQQGHGFPGRVGAGVQERMSPRRVEETDGSRCTSGSREAQELGKQRNLGLEKTC